MKSQCKTCGKNCEGEYCFRHKLRKRISVQNFTKNVKKEESLRNIFEMRDFFLQIWKKRVHKSEVSGEYLASEPLHVFFHHILPKEKYPQAMLDEENIILLTMWEHADVEADVYKYEEINNRREKLKKKYEIN
tara:strand:- start:368 stop:766 length:399 start_codon:yes stop_codon:yes gene_type:complete